MVIMRIDAVWLDVWGGVYCAMKRERGRGDDGCLTETKEVERGWLREGGDSGIGLLGWGLRSARMERLRTISKLENDKRQYPRQEIDKWRESRAVRNVEHSKKKKKRL